MEPLTRATMAAALAGLALAGCEKARDLPSTAGEWDGNGMHPDGWADLKKKDTDAFHAKWFQARRKDHGDELQQIATCRKCHGYDYEGGSTGVSCTSKGCHTQKGGPEFCGTCHGSDKGPMPVDPKDPTTGAHELHKQWCDQCHDVPKGMEWPNHLNNKIDVLFSGLALTNKSTPAFDPKAVTCSGVYCHGQKPCTGDADCGSVAVCEPTKKVCQPKWTTPQNKTPCDFCHQLPPPAMHSRWPNAAKLQTTDMTDGATLGGDQTGCGKCHPVHTTPMPEGTHIDGTFQVKDDIGCGVCHGDKDAPNDSWKIAPIPSLDGTIDPSKMPVGAHQRHLDPAFAGRIAGPYTCDKCHPVPKTVFEVGHFMTASGQIDQDPADVTLWRQGTYTRDAQGVGTCTVYCHWNNPVDWTADSSKPFTPPDGCSTCHGFPPLYLRDGSAHTQPPADINECKKCHPFGLDTHINGTVEYVGQ